MESIEALREMVTLTLRYLPNEVINKVSEFSNIVLQDLKNYEELKSVDFNVMLVKNENKSLKEELETLRESLQSEIEMLTNNRNEIMKENTRLRKIISIIKKYVEVFSEQAIPEIPYVENYYISLKNKEWFDEINIEEEYELLEEEFNKK